MSTVQKERYAKILAAYNLLMELYPFQVENLDGEIWKWIQNYEGIYQLSTYTRVRSFQINKVSIIKPALNPNGYLTICLCKNGKSRTLKLHRLMAETFLPNPAGKLEVHHLNGDKLNCFANNLCYVTRQEHQEMSRALARASIGVEFTAEKVNPAPDTSTDLVFIHNNQALTDSRKVAAYFGKRHDHVIRDIRAIIDQMGGVPKIGETPLFEETVYVNSQNGQAYPMFLMNRDGFTLLAMGFTGKEALQFKLAYIAKFNEMERALSNPAPADKESALAFLKEIFKDNDLRDKYLQKILDLIMRV